MRCPEGRKSHDGWSASYQSACRTAPTTCPADRVSQRRCRWKKGTDRSLQMNLTTSSVSGTPTALAMLLPVLCAADCAACGKRNLSRHNLPGQQTDESYDLNFGDACERTARRGPSRHDTPSRPCVSGTLPPPRPLSAHLCPPLCPRVRTAQLRREVGRSGGRRARPLWGPNRLLAADECETCG